MDVPRLKPRRAGYNGLLDRPSLEPQRADNKAHEDALTVAHPSLEPRRADNKAHTDASRLNPRRAGYNT